MTAKIVLSGPWLIRHDPLAQGLAERWWERPPREGWVEIGVPSAWQSVLGAEANGVAWYRKTMPALSADWRADDRRVWLRFEAVATECRAFVNGREVGRHVGDFVPFEFEITEALRAMNDDAELFVRVDQWHAPRPAKGCVTENGHITKGFHDVLSVQHAGIWGEVSVRKTGPLAFVPGGVHVVANPDRGTVDVAIELHPHDAKGRVTVEAEIPYAAPGGGDLWAGGEKVAEIKPGQRTVSVSYERHCEGNPALWSPSSPTLGSLALRLGIDGMLDGTTTDECSARFGFRGVNTGGARRRQILLNGTPTLIRGVLHWGHEPRHIAPMPARDEVREQFRQLRSRGFNCVCVCLVYMPEYFYDIADETGMLIWQEHPVWKSRMGAEFHAEYKRLYEAFFRRDRNHPSVVIVSGSCEHEAFDPALAAWWWGRAGHHLPHALKQVQTAFFAWTPPDQTDLYDEHTYDNSGRWVRYVKDVRAAIGRLAQPDKPFIMGETVISNAWPDVRTALSDLGSQDARLAGPSGNSPRASPWWVSRGLQECAFVERDIESMHGGAALERFRRQAHQHNLNLRKFHCEVLRMDPGTAGWIMNHVRDVPACRCGFMDDLDRWRYSESELRPFLSDAVLLLETPDMRQSFVGGRTIDGAVLLSNFSEREFVGEVVVAIGSTLVTRNECRAGRGEIGRSAFALALPDVAAPTRLAVRSSAGGTIENNWSIWVFPSRPGRLVGAVSDGARAMSAAELALDFEERCYSSGWGLPVETWHPRNPDVGELFPNLPIERELGTSTAQIVVTHRLTHGVVEYLARGGRVLLLASKCAGGLDARTLMQWSGVPWVAESGGPFGAGDSEWIVDLLHHDLTRKYHRAVPTEEMGISGNVRSMIRFYATHDSGRPKVFDLLFAARVGAGVLCVSTLDHGDDAGLYVLDRVLVWLAVGSVEEEVSPEFLGRYMTE